MTVPWTPADGDHHTSSQESSPPSSSFCDSVKLCVIRFDSVIEAEPSQYKPVVIVNDVFFNLHSRTIPDSDKSTENGDGFSEKVGSHISQYRKYTIFIIICTYYEPAKVRFDTNDCRLKVKTSGKHRKLMLKSSFVGLDDDGEIDDHLLGRTVAEE